MPFSISIQVSDIMAEVRARVDFKVGPKSNIEAELLSFIGLTPGKEHVAVIFKMQIVMMSHL